MTNSPIDLPYLPDDLLLNCLARVSRLYYPILSLVSKRFRSLVASHELYDIRKFIGRTENCLYMFLGSGSNARWFTLCPRPTPKPNPNPSRNPNSGCFISCFRPVRIQNNRKNIMVPVPTRNYGLQFGSTSKFSNTIGTNIYIIGGYINGAVSSKVFFMDCRSHTWHEAPSMRIAQACPLLSVLDGKLYVVDGNNPSGSSIEFFDPKIQIWKHVSGPNAELRTYLASTFVFEEKLYLIGCKSVVYKPKENKWEVVRLIKTPFWAHDSSSSTCVIDNVTYSCNVAFSKNIVWYDSEKRFWRELKSSKDLPKLKLSRDVRLVDYCGKIAVLWEEKVRGIGINKKKMIWCAVIAPERRNAQEIYGKIEWCNVVLTVPESCSVLQFNAVTL